MKSLDLNAYGVEEMSQHDMKNVEGGFVFLVAFVVGCIASFLYFYLDNGGADPDCPCNC